MKPRHPGEGSGLNVSGRPALVLGGFVVLRAGR
jgi:hypothetical protein